MPGFFILNILNLNLKLYICINLKYIKNGKPTNPR
jgi:hypothetical protein